MEERYSLQGRLVAIFLRGGWEFTGVVEFASKEKVVLLSDMGSLVVYKENIVAAMIIEDKRKIESIDQVKASQYQDGMAMDVPRARLNPPGHIEEQDQYGAIIPEDMLDGKSDSINNTFSLSMSEMKTPIRQETSFDSIKKNEFNRGKDKKGL